ncbi:hypothetical protein PIB30_009509 [Stylosanthes scabra]|uniref:PB1 domain-containing protein n=1 Tax=Stylosanthes scabra TaxID=79078 RepID=A0ABU6Y3D5_9FABA|nr:hypothetical protein [Stylosanthes scabra]
MDGDDDSMMRHQQHSLKKVQGAKLRLMCSYGGNIMPHHNHNHDSLSLLHYVGGDTRMVAVERNTSLKDLSARLSNTFLHGRPFTLKYQLPDHQLDNLITVVTDDDLQNMIQEYDRFASLSPPLRLRLFLFLSKLDTAASMGALLNDAKSETWFVDALNNSGMMNNISRVVSDSAAVDECLLSLADELIPDRDQHSKVMDHHFAQLKLGNAECHDDDDEGEYRNNKPPPPPTFAAYGLPSPDSVVSDSSIASSISKGLSSNTSTQHHTLHLNGQQVDPNQQQQQFVYIQPQPHPHVAASPTGQVAMSSYHHTLYAPQSNQQHYPVYVMPLDISQVPTNYPTMLTTPTNIPDTHPAFLHQQRYVPLPHHPIAVATPTNYAAAPKQDHQLLYYTQTQPQQHQSSAPQTLQYQSMTPPAAALSDVSKEFPL